MKKFKVTLEIEVAVAAKSKGDAADKALHVGQANYTDLVYVSDVSESFISIFDPDKVEAYVNPVAALEVPVPEL